MHILYKKYILYFYCSCIIASTYAMDKDINTIDLESGSETTHSYVSLHQAAEQCNPLNRKRSPWTNFYTVAGIFIGSGISVATTWHLAKTSGAETVDDNAPIVYIAGTLIASIGLCCYFTTQGVTILHNTYKKFNKKQLAYT